MKPRLSLLLVLGLILLLMLPALAAILLRYLWAVCVNPPRGWQIAMAFDRLANAAANGDSKFTISSRAAEARAQGKPWACRLCRVLDWLDANHCNKSSGI